MKFYLICKLQTSVNVMMVKVSNLTQITLLPSIINQHSNQPVLKKTRNCEKYGCYCRMY